MFCRVRHCRFPATHVTSEHKCGKCNQFGHGQVECYHPSLKDSLQAYFDEELPHGTGCTICKSKKHMTQAHHCLSCKLVICSEMYCHNCSSTNVTCPSCKILTRAHINAQLFTGNSCIICYEDKPVIRYDCKHCNVCLDCTLLIH